nr:hypothetical protein CFP56_01949 [Quercus suber]
MECKKVQQHMEDGHETWVDSDEGFSQGERTVSYVSERSCCRNRMRELENLWKQVNDLEIELRGRHHRRDREDLFDDPNYIVEESSRGSFLRWLRDRYRETMERYHKSP